MLNKFLVMINKKAKLRGSRSAWMFCHKIQILLFFGGRPARRYLMVKQARVARWAVNCHCIQASRPEGLLAILTGWPESFVPEGNHFSMDMRHLNESMVKASTRHGYSREPGCIPNSRDGQSPPQEMEGKCQNEIISHFI